MKREKRQEREREKRREKDVQGQLLSICIQFTKKLNILAEMLEISKSGRIYSITLSLQELLSELKINESMSGKICTF